MKNVTVISRSVLAVIKLSAKDWEAFADMEGAEAAAQEINDVIAQYANAGAKRHEVRNTALAVMGKHADLGFIDSEPLWHLHNLLNVLYGEGAQE